MCTITALPRALLQSDPNPDRLLLRVALNRDERVTREPALPPTLWAAGARRALMPIDPGSGGTWIAASDAGIVFALLNACPGHPVRAGRVSRGTIIPTLIGSATMSQALAQAQSIDVTRFAPFRLVLIDRFQIVDCWPDADRIRHRRAYLHGAVLRASSSLGDAIVSGPRRALFQRVVTHSLDARTAQDEFHRHQWPGREDISVNMRRDDARTVSHTVVDVREGSVTMSYRALDWPRAVAVRVAA
jgi:hypothetical protein